MITPNTSHRAVIVGSGVAGLSAALALGDCLVVTKTGLGDGSSVWAQGGIAAALGPDDHPQRHAADTVAVAGGLADRGVADLVAGAAPGRIDWLIELGARFDRAPDGSLLLGREAGHTRHRIVHADGDATGAELMRTLRQAVRERPDIEVLEHTFAADLLGADGRIVGVATITPDGDHRLVVAPAVVVATGGVGRIYSATTNPAEVTGDGLAMAIRAGARIVDPEFVQFHPTAMRSPLDPMPLLTEALRGAGAKLVDHSGRHFMGDEHPDADLAPRDVVARAIWRRLHDGSDVLLDATHLGDDFPERFPTVFAATMRAGIDPRRRGVPVSPAAHYHMGGIAVDLFGRSSLPGLYACGEASVTGLHGANRLASNSLLEGLVYGARVAAAIRAEHGGAAHHIEIPQGALGVGVTDDTEAITRLRTLMWDHVGVMRTEQGLRGALKEMGELQTALETDATGRNLLTVARTVTEAALARRESRGGHFRLDHPAASSVGEEHTVVDPVPEARTPLVARTATA